MREIVPMPRRVYTPLPSYIIVVLHPSPVRGMLFCTYVLTYRVSFDQWTATCEVRGQKSAGVLDRPLHYVSEDFL